MAGQQTGRTYQKLTRFFKGYHAIIIFALCGGCTHLCLSWLRHHQNCFALELKGKTIYNTVRTLSECCTNKLDRLTSMYIGVVLPLTRFMTCRRFHSFNIYFYFYFLCLGFEVLELRKGCILFSLPDLSAFTMFFFRPGTILL